MNSAIYQKRGLFVAGTDTGVGKTIVAAGLVKLASIAGLEARAVKPVETGCPVISGALHPVDGAFLQRASGGGVTLDDCAPFRFAMPASPYRASAMEGGRLRMADMVEHVRAVAENADLTIVEGAGGLMVPIQQGALMIDFLAELAFPALLVARRSLGTINHTLLSLEALDKRGISPVGVVLSCVSEQSGPEEDFTPGDLGRLVGPVPVVELPHLPWAAREDPGEIARSMSSAFNQDILERWLGT